MRGCTAGRTYARTNKTIITTVDKQLTTRFVSVYTAHRLWSGVWPPLCACMIIVTGAYWIRKTVARACGCVCVSHSLHKQTIN